MKKEVFGVKSLCLLLFLCFSMVAFSQQYTGMSGLIHVPSADMDDTGDARIGAHFLNKEFLPEKAFDCEGRYSSTNHYLSITPFSWMELGYTCTLRKGYRDGNINKTGGIGFYHKDRYFSIKIQPIKEKKWWPSIALGSNDPISTHDIRGFENQASLNPKGSGSLFFSNYYIATTKHFDLWDNSIGIHIAYRKWKREYNSKWNGLVGGITYQPSFQKNLRMIAEYTGNDINVGFDWKLWKHLLLQTSLQNGKYFSGGICYQVNLF